MRAYALYRAGTAAYADRDIRWGDYSGISLDPGGASMWMITEYAGTPNPHFGTSIIQVSGPPPLTISPTSFFFGGVDVGSTSGTEAFTVTNSSSSPVTVSSVTLGGTNPGDFAMTADNCASATLNASSSCTLSANFSPMAQGLRSATIMIVSASSGGSAASQVIALSGNGGSPSTLAVSPTSLSFPDTPIRTSSAAQTVTLTNAGASPLNIFSFAAFNDYAQTNNCIPAGASQGSLAGGAQCTINVTFRPTMTGAHNQLLQVVNDTATPYINIPLTGNGVIAPEVTLCPTSVRFGNQTVGASSAAQAMTISNTGSDNLTISAITASGDFAASNSCGSHCLYGQHNIHADGRWGAHGKAQRDRLGERQPPYCRSRRNRRGVLYRRAGIHSWHGGGRGTAPGRSGCARYDRPQGRA